MSNFNEFEINFNGATEIWCVSPDNDCAVYSYKRAKEMIEATGKTMPTSSELFEIDSATGNSRLELLKKAGADFWAWVADKAINPLNSCFVISSDGYKGESPALCVRGIICR